MGAMGAGGFFDVITRGCGGGKVVFFGGFPITWNVVSDRRKSGVLFRMAGSLDCEVM